MASRERAKALLGVACLVIFALLPSTASGAPNGPVRVVVDPTTPCLDRTAFERALFARITRPRGGAGSGPGDAAETEVVVRVEPEGERFAGRVVVREPGEEPRERVVRGTSCADVALSVVLVAALALGGEPDGDPGRPRPTLREPADDAADERPPSPPASAALPATRWTPLVGAHGGVSTAGAGEASMSGDAFGELAMLRTGIAPGLRVALAYAAAERSDGAVAMRVSTATMRVEPSLLRMQAGRVAARLGLALEGGAAFADASGTRRADPATRPWLRGGAQAEVAVDVLGPMAIEATAGALVAFVRDDFVVEPSGFGLRAPLVAPVCRIGILLRLR